MIFILFLFTYRSDVLDRTLGAGCDAVAGLIGVVEAVGVDIGFGPEDWRKTLLRRVFDQVGHVRAGNCQGQGECN